MKTNELTQLLSQDTRVLPAPERALWMALTPALAVAAAALLLLVGLRPDLSTIWVSYRFAFKLLLSALLAVAALLTLLQLARPGENSKSGFRMLIALGLALGFAVTMELIVLAPADWKAAAIGENSTVCLQVIPALALVPFAAGFWVLRQAAPDRPMLAGAINGLMAAGWGAALYALHCQDDSPLFVAIWYVLAAASMAAVGALLGRRLLRW
jgi:hypothetical protein